MDDAKFDRLALAFAKTLNRRRMVAAISAATGMHGQEAARGSPIAAATCGEQGAVCTLVFGCCDGLTCVTSAINTSYGICVPGDGGMVSTGTTLISPFSETAVDEVSALMQEDSTTPAPDPDAERQARAADIRARRETRRTERKTRFDTKRATIRARKDKQRNRQREAREAEEVARGPQLQVKLHFGEVDPDSGVNGDPLIPIEVVKVTNRGDVNVVLTSIETIKGASDGVGLTGSQFTLGPGDSFSFVSGLPTEDSPDATKDQYRWLDKVACDGTVQKQGYRVEAVFSRGGETHDFVVFCHGRHTTSAIATPAAAPPRKRKNNGEQKHKRSSQHQKKRKR
jgi:hypothetical protein